MDFAIVRQSLCLRRKASLWPFAARGTIGGGGGTACSISFETGWTMPSPDARTTEHRSGACYPNRQPIRILVQAPCVGTQPVYESLQGEGSWPSRTPRRCHVTRCRVTRVHRLSPVFTLPSRAKATIALIEPASASPLPSALHA